MPDEEEEKPWVAYLKSLKTPMMCPLHRKVLLLLTTYIEVTQTQKTKKEKFSAKVYTRKVVNKNPNCNHNSSSIFYNHSFSNIKYDDVKKEETEKQNLDLLWANGEKYNEKDEIKSLKELVLRLFHEPYFGEKKSMAALMKSKSQGKDDATSLYSEFEKYFGHEEILIDGYKINKLSLWTIKKLNPHHKALLFTLVELSKLPTRGLAREIVNE